MGPGSVHDSPVKSEAIPVSDKLQGGTEDNKNFGLRLVKVRAGFRYFRESGDGKGKAFLKTLFNFTVAGWFSRVCYVYNSKVEDDLQVACKAEADAADETADAVVDIQTVRKPVISMSPYQPEKHKGAIMVIGNNGGEFAGRIEGYQLMQRLGINGSMESEGVDGYHMPFEQEKSLPCYQLDVADSGRTDWKEKINNAGACLICVSTSPYIKMDDNIDHAIKSIRQLPIDENGLPDMGKVRFVLTDAHIIHKHMMNRRLIKDGEARYTQYIDSFKKSLSDGLKKEFCDYYAYDIYDANCMVVGNGDGDYMATPYDIRRHLSHITAFDPAVPPPINSSELPDDQLKLAREELQAACKPELTDYSYWEKQHKGAVMVIENEGMGLNGRGDELMQRLGIDSATEAEGVKGCSIALEKGRALPVYQLSPSGVEGNNENRDWPLKINNAGVCLISIPAVSEKELDDCIGYVMQSIRHLPPDRDGRPDVSKVRFVFTDDHDAHDQIDEGSGLENDGNVEPVKYTDRFREALCGELKKTFGNHSVYDIPEESFIVPGAGDGMTPPDRFKYQLAETTASLRSDA